MAGEQCGSDKVLQRVLTHISLMFFGRILEPLLALISLVQLVPVPETLVLFRHLTTQAEVLQLDLMHISLVFDSSAKTFGQLLTPAFLSSLVSLLFPTATFLAFGSLSTQLLQ